MTLQPIPSEFPYIWGQFLYLFYHCSMLVFFPLFPSYLCGSPQHNCSLIGFITCLNCVFLLPEYSLNIFSSENVFPVRHLHVRLVSEFPVHLFTKIVILSVRSLSVSFFIEKEPHSSREWNEREKAKGGGRDTTSACELGHSCIAQGYCAS